eukprot:2145572-Amphidinium_carterae.1
MTVWSWQASSNAARAVQHILHAAGFPVQASSSKYDLHCNTLSCHGLHASTSRTWSFSERQWRYQWTTMT